MQYFVTFDCTLLENKLTTTTTFADRNQLAAIVISVRPLDSILMWLNSRGTLLPWKTKRKNKWAAHDDLTKVSDAELWCFRWSASE